MPIRNSNHAVAGLLVQVLSCLLVLVGGNGSTQPPPDKLFCRPGKFQAYGLTGCQACAPGRYQSAHASVVVCSLCPTGKFQAQYGAASCRNCAPGYYNGNQGVTSCRGCAPPLSSAPGAGKCTKCPPGNGFGQRKTPSSPSLCTQCAAGRFELGFLGGFFKTPSCVRCPNGKFSHRNTMGHCRSCPTGRAINDDQSGCTHCRAGTYVAKASTGCAMCPAGKFSPQAGALGCKACMPGFFGLGGSRTEQCSGMCAPGRYGMLAQPTALCYGACSSGYAGQGGSTTPSCDGPCPAGKFSATAGSTSCTACPSGQFQPYRGDTSCAHCARGRFAPYNYVGNTECKRCPWGEYRTIRGDNCQDSLPSTGHTTTTTSTPTPTSTSTSTSTFPSTFSSTSTTTTTAPANPHPNPKLGALATTIRPPTTPTAAPSRVPTPIPTPVWTAPPTPRPENSCNRVRMQGQLPGQPGSHCMGSYVLQPERVMGLPIYRFTGPTCGGSAIALLYFNDVTQQWVVGPRVGAPPFVLMADGSATDYQPYNVTATWQVTMHDGRRAPQPWIRVVCLKSFGHGTTIVRPEHRLPVGAPTVGTTTTHAIKRHAAATTRAPVGWTATRERAATTTPAPAAFVLHASIALVSSLITRRDFLRAIANVVKVPRRAVHVEAWNSGVQPVLATVRIEISQYACFYMMPSSCNAETGKLGLAQSIAKPKFARDVLAQLHKQDTALVKGDLRVASVHLARPSAQARPFAVASVQHSALNTTTATTTRAAVRSPLATFVNSHGLVLAIVCIAFMWVVVALLHWQRGLALQQVQRKRRLVELRAQWGAGGDAEPLQVDWHKMYAEESEVV